MNKSKYFVYHIFGEKIGATEDLDRRVFLQQGCTEEDFEILLETDDIMEASKAEIHFQKLHGYEIDSTPFHVIKQKTDMTQPLIVKKGSHHKWFGNRDLMPKDIKETVTTRGIDFLVDGEVVKTFRTEEDADYLYSITQISHKTSGVYWAPRAVLKWTQMVSEYKPVEGSKDNPNVCSDLDIPALDGENLDTCFELQYSLQRKFPETANIGDQSIADTAMAAQRNFTAFVDEYTEFMEALGGVKDGFGNGSWKYWKQDHNTAKNMKISDLSESDLKELKMEYTDLFHFFINFGLMIGMTGTELISYYIAKNKENFNRQKRGY